MRFSKSTAPTSQCPQNLTSGLLIEWPTENGPNREILASQDSVMPVRMREPISDFVSRVGG